MKNKFAGILGLAVLLIYCEIILSDDNPAGSNSLQLPPIETCFLEPIELENISVWVPAVKAVPQINRACLPRRNCSYSSVLLSSVCHTKTDFCPEGVARLLAEYAACYYERSIPLTIFNGWQWEYSYSLCQFESVTYDLPARGGCWENLWEAILMQGVGSANLQWVEIGRSDDFAGKSGNSRQKSSIEVKTFSSMRTRNGYPKERQL